MTQAPNPFTQAASQGYGDFAPTLDEEEQEEHEEQAEQEEGPQSPEADEHQIDEIGFTQTQERSYPTGDIESPDEEEDEDENNQIESQPPSPENVKQSQQRRRVQIMNDSDNEDEDQIQSTSVVNKEKKIDFLKQFTTKNDDSQKEHKKRRTDEYQNEKKSKRFRETSNEVEATSDVEDVVDNIFGKEMNEDEDEVNDRDEVAAELADLDNNEVVQEEEEEEEDAEQQQQQETFDAEEDDEPSTRKEHYDSSKNSISYDIDLYLEKKAERRRGQRRRGKGDSIDISDPGADQLAAKLVERMKIATEEDRIFNKNRQPATAKLLLLPTVEQYLCRADLAEIFLDHGILTVFSDWLSPLPDKSLSNIKIRQALIKILQQFGIIDADKLRDSGIGKALMFLYKHPRETKENKLKLIKIIHEWARPIFNLDTDYKLLTREERQQRDADQASLKRQTSLTGKPKNRSVDVDLPFASDRRNNDDDGLNKDDDDCPRARVPRLSNRDYVVRPVSTVEYSDKKNEGKKKSFSRIDEIRRRQQDRKRLSKPMSIVKLSIEGNKMHL